jgi:head-tail adaptor
MTTRLGELARHRFTVRAPDQTSATGFTDVANVRGALEFATASEQLQYAVPTAVAQWRITLRYRDDVKADWQMYERDEARTFQVVGYNPIRVDDRLVVFCAELQ